MGRAKEKMIEDQWIESMIKPIAKYIGIDEHELEQLEFEIENDSSNDGLIYSTIVEFSEESAKELEGIIDLEDGLRLRIHPSELDFYDDDYYDFEYDKDEFDSLIRDKNTKEKLLSEISDLKILMEINLDDNSLENILLRQIYIGLIGTMETYLSETFIKNVIDKEEYLRNFVETHHDFKKRKFELREIFNKNENLIEIAKTVMLDTIYHNLPIIQNMFRNTLKIDFPSIGKLHQAVLKRHDLVHRNGETKDGQSLVVSKDELTVLMKDLTDFVDKIESQI